MSLTTEGFTDCSMLVAVYYQTYWPIGEAGINVHDVLPVTTPRSKRMMPPADRIYDPGQGAKKDLIDTGDDFLANHATKCRRSVSSQVWSH